VRILTFNVPETEHLPVSEREEILKHCLASQELRRYRNIGNPILGAVPALITISFMFLSIFRWRFQLLAAFLSGLAVAFGSFAICAAIKFCIEIRILRKLAEKQARR
jgi:hypothetical protein